MKLHEQVKALRDENSDLKATIRYLRDYLRSPKFHQDTTVQVDDVLRRLPVVYND